MDRLHEGKHRRFVPKSHYINEGKEEIAIPKMAGNGPLWEGFVAMMKALRPALTAGECRDILQKTSYDIPEQGSQWYEPGGCGRVADIDRALSLLWWEGTEREAGF